MIRISSCAGGVAGREVPSLLHFKSGIHLARKIYSSYLYIKSTSTRPATLKHHPAVKKNAWLSCSISSGVGVGVRPGAGPGAGSGTGPGAGPGS